MSESTQEAITWSVKDSTGIEIEPNYDLCGAGSDFRPAMWRYQGGMYRGYVIDSLESDGSCKVTFAPVEAIK